MKSRGGTGDTARTLAVCERHVADRDDMVVKAMSWALRELAERDPDAVCGFLASHMGRGGLAPRVLRETKNKLETG
jgi:3-methyladenine DNA glycosylase AlkD